MRVLLSFGVCPCRLERSTDQVIKPINLEALSKWVGQIPEDVVRDMAKVAPMLSELGYDPHANPPNYGRPDSFVLNNTLQIKRDTAEWRARELELAQHRDAIRRGAIKRRMEEDVTNRTPTT